MEPEQVTIKPLEAFLIIFAGFFFSLLPQGAIVALFPGALEGEVSPTGLKLALVVGELSLIILPIFYVRMKKLSVTEIFRWESVPRHILLIMLPVGFSLAIVVDEIDRLFQIILPMPELLSEEITKLMQAGSGLELVLIILSAVVLASIVEESIFRGLLQGAIEKHINVTQGVIYASLAWAAIHLNLYQAMQIFLFGFVMGYLAWRTGSILPAVICHAMNNAIAVVSYNVDISKDLPFYEWGGHVTPFILIPALWVVVKGIQYIDQYYRGLSSPLSTSSLEE